MTVVAALRIEGIPALIGDFLITDGQRGIHHAFLPTRPNLNNPAHPTLPRRIKGLGRKLHVINQRFVVGFTGSVEAGAAIFADLERRFGHSNRAPSISEISHALEAFNVQFNGRATIIGWTVSSRPRCFRWSARPGSPAVHVTHAIEGSGGHHFAEVLTNAVSGGYSDAVRTAFERAILLGLAKVGAVLVEEMTTGANLKESYGAGAEIVLFQGNRFQFISKLGYVFWNARIELDGSITILPSNVFAAYEARERYCLLEVIQLDLRTNPIKAENAYLQAITPLHDNMPALILTKADEVSPECDYYFNGIAFLDRRTNVLGTIRVSGIMSDDLCFRVKKKDGLHFFEWDRQMLEGMIRTAALVKGR